MFNHLRSSNPEQGSATENLPRENKQRPEAAGMAPQQAVEPDSFFGALVWIAPPLALIAVLAISAI